MNSTQIQCFLRAAGEHSFTKAASSLFMTQQSVSRQIALLEEELGTPLFDRTASRITLTPAGELYVSILSAADRSLDVLKETLTDHQRALRQRFRVGISQWLDPFGALQKVIAQSRQAHPAIALELLQLDNEALFHELTNGGLDAAFFSEGQCPQSREVKSRRIAEGRLCLYAPEDVLADSSPGAIDRCWGLPMLMVPAWEYSFLERRLIGGQEQAEFNLHPAKIMTPPNLHSLELSLRFGRYTTVGDDRFGVFRRIPGLGRIPLPLQEHLLLVRPAGQTHPLLEEFAAMAEAVLAADEPPENPDQ